MKRLEPPIELETPKGIALAIFVENPGFDAHLEWTCIVRETREIWTFLNHEVRATKNWTFGVGRNALDP